MWVMNDYRKTNAAIDALREERYAQLMEQGVDLSNTYTTQKGSVYGMVGATCPRCSGPSKLSHRSMPSGMFVCPNCEVIYDEPDFDPDEFIADVDDEDE